MVAKIWKHDAYELNGFRVKQQQHTDTHSSEYNTPTSVHSFTPDKKLEEKSEEQEEAEMNGMLPNGLLSSTDEDAQSYSTSISSSHDARNQPNLQGNAVTSACFVAEFGARKIDRYTAFDHRGNVGIFQV